jgi:hypothetical protein
MKYDVLTWTIIVVSIVSLLTIAAMVIEPFFGAHINPVALTRHTITLGERIEPNIASNLQTKDPANDLPYALGEALKQSGSFKEGYIKLKEGKRPVALDGWGRPFRVTLRKDFERLPNASPTVLRKTNEILIWSLGPNGIDESGNGDDIFIPPTKP